MSNIKLPTANSGLEQWLRYIESGHDKVIDLGLDRLAKVYQRLGHPRPAKTLVTVAGTNGKGTTIALLNQLLTLQNQNVACYTSPHLVRFNERVLINNQTVSDEQLCEAFSKIEACRDEVTLTYFEYVTLAAFWVMSQYELDIALLEIGMGGRLDAVNLLDPDLAVITSIDLDHCAWLGDTREKIAFEKAGIMRSGIPVISGETNPPAAIKNHAQTLSAQLYQRGSEFSAAAMTDGSWCWDGLLANGESVSIQGLPYPNIPFDNAVTAIQTFALLFDSLPLDIITSSLERTSVEGRYQILNKPFPCILDVAHNPASGRCLAERLSRELRFGCPKPVDNSGHEADIKSHKRFHALLSVLDDKDVSGLLKPLQHGFDSWLVTALQTERSVAIEHLTSQLQAIGVNAYQALPDVKSALEYYADNIYQDDNDVLVVFGSFYTVSDALSVLRSVG